MTTPCGIPRLRHLAGLPSELLDLVALLAAQQVLAAAPISLGLADVFAQRPDAQVTRDLRIGRPDSSTNRIPRSNNSS